MAWNTTAQDLQAILTKRRAELSERLGGRGGIFEAQDGPIAGTHIQCQDVTINCYINRTGELEWVIEFPCGVFGTPSKGICKGYTDLFFLFLEQGFGLDRPPTTPLTRKDGVVVDLPDVQFTVMFEELEYLAAHLLFDPHRRDLAAAYVAGRTCGYNYR